MTSEPPLSKRIIRQYKFMSQEQINKIQVHDENNIKGFFGEYRWLSNFHLCPVEYEGVVYPSSENAYMAAKLIPEDRVNLVGVTPKEAKKLWKNYRLLDKSAEEWDYRKASVMFRVLYDKFDRNHDLMAKLKATDKMYLEETNFWNDVFWGKCDGKGENRLGILLALIREMSLFHDEIKEFNKK